METIIVPREIADAIYHLRSEGFENRDILKILHTGSNNSNNKPHVEFLQDYSQDSYNDLLQALILGFEIERTPEEWIGQFYMDTYDRHDSGEYCDGLRDGIVYVLNQLQVEIKGVNKE